MTPNLTKIHSGNTNSTDEIIAGTDCPDDYIGKLLTDWMQANAQKDDKLGWRMTAEKLIGKLKQKDIETTQHALRVSAFSLRIAMELNINEENLTKLWLGSLLHDIGKSVVPDEILKKKGALDENEWLVMRTHAAAGKEILRQSKLPKEVWIIAAEHHERYDGQGYPNGIGGENIHISARIFAVADCFDAITSNRCYRPKQNYQAARTEIIRVAGSQFDPKVVEAFCRISDEEWSEEKILLKRQALCKSKSSK